MALKNVYRVLIVDDDDNVRSLLRRELEHRNITCEEAADGIVAENALRRTRYDAVICDLVMPRKHGHKLIVETLDHESPPMIIAMTGLAEPKLVSDLISRGVVDVMQKPIQWSILGAKLHALLERKAMMGPGGRVSPNLISSKITEATTNLKSQLTDVTKSFQKTINVLEEQREHLEEGFVGSIRVLTSIFSHSDQAKGSHAGRVEKMAVALAQNMEIGGERLRNIRIAALLHEIGMFYMPDAVRLKAPWELAPKEYEAYQKYPLVGATLLSELSGAAEFAELIEMHTENYDGSGFPAGVKGENIPMGARILRIADGCDTFLMYLASGSRQTEIREHLLKQRGKYYDPDLVGHALTYVSQEIERTEAERTILVLPDELAVGQILAENVFDGEGRFLARNGAAVSANMLSLLRRLLWNSKVRIHAPDTNGTR
jgi:response regulator RpfG family c-di-GMP phosphodiesterase